MGFIVGLWQEVWKTALSPSQYELKFLSHTVFFKFYIQICRFWCILTAIESLYIADEWVYSWGGWVTPKFVVDFPHIPRVHAPQSVVASPWVDVVSQRMATTTCTGSALCCSHQWHHYAIIIISSSRIQQPWTKERRGGAGSWTAGSGV